MKKSIKGRTFLIEDSILTDTIYDIDFPLPNWTIQLTPVNGFANVFASNDGENWEAWPNGEVNTSIIEAFSPVRYLKITNVSAETIKVIIRGC